MSKEINKYLKQLYPDISPETIDFVPPERKKQYERDFATILENYEEFLENFSSSQNIHGALYKVKFTKYMDKAFPGYKQMSPARQEECEFRFGFENLNMTEIDIIYAKLTDPNDPMYNPKLSEKDLVNLAAIYAKTYKDSQKKIGHKTGKITHDSKDWFKAVDEIEYLEPTDQEQEILIRDSLAEYNKRNRFNIKNILTGVKKHQITLEDALQTKDYLKKALTPAQLTKEENEVEVNM